MLILAQVISSPETYQILFHLHPSSSKPIMCLRWQNKFAENCIRFTYIRVRSKDCLKDVSRYLEVDPRSGASTREVECIQDGGVRDEVRVVQQKVLFMFEHTLNLSQLMIY